MVRKWSIWMAALAAGGSAAAGQMGVQVQSTALRGTPSFLGEVLTSLTYNQVVESLETRGAWNRVQVPGGQRGWVHQSALAPKRVAWRPGSASGNAGASTDEMALAGKGFNAQVEKEFRAGNTEADFASVDRMSRIRIDSREITAFAAEGGLNKADGGAQ